MCGASLCAAASGLSVNVPIVLLRLQVAPAGFLQRPEQRRVNKRAAGRRRTPPLLAGTQPGTRFNPGCRWNSTSSSTASSSSVLISKYLTPCCLSVQLSRSRFHVCFCSARGSEPLKITWDKSKQQTRDFY